MYNILDDLNITTFDSELDFHDHIEKSCCEALLYSTKDTWFYTVGWY